jgi:hypothetical protein
VTDHLALGLPLAGLDCCSCHEPVQGDGPSFDVVACDRDLIYDGVLFDGGITACGVITLSCKSGRRGHHESGTATETSEAAKSAVPVDGLLVAL